MLDMIHLARRKSGPDCYRDTSNTSRAHCSTGSWSLWIGICLLLLWAACAVAEPRFPPPEFESGHQVPATQTPAARAVVFQYLDVIVLAASLGMATWLVQRKRSRKGLILLSLFSVSYFGFWRKGCVCAIGSVQNIALAVADSSCPAPLSVIAFFVLPLAFALLVGRSFCAGVCPHGALQDLVLIKPIKMPGWLESGLGLVPFVYLGAGVLFAATGSAFIFCKYDPFVPIFRMSGRALMVISGAAFLVLGLFVGRPYCRFLCPYGAMLKLAGMVSKWRVRVTPAHCTQCRLCENSCPFGALHQPQSVQSNEPQSLALDRARLGKLLVLVPVIVVLGGWLGSQFSRPAARMHPTVALAEKISIAPGTLADARGSAQSAEGLAIERASQMPDEILQEATQIRRRFVVGGWIFGAWVGFVIGSKLVSLSVRRQRTDYEPDRGDCFACARCFAYCPVVPET